MSTAASSPQSALFKIGRLLALLGGAWGVSITLALLFLPILQYCTVTVSPLVPSLTAPSIPVTNCGYTTLLESQGGGLEAVTWAYLGAMTGLSLLAIALSLATSRPNRWRGVGLLAIWTVLTLGMLIAGFSIGLYYSPAVLLLLLGASSLFVG